MQPAARVSAVDRFELLNTYVCGAGGRRQLGLFLRKTESVVEPGEGGAMMISDDALPIYMFRVSRVAPFRLPWVTRLARSDEDRCVLWQVVRRRISPAPHAARGKSALFKPTQNLELGWSRMAELGGGRPPVDDCRRCSILTPDSRSLPFTMRTTTVPASATAVLVSSYSLPFVRNWLSYLDSIASDDSDPVDTPRRARAQPGTLLVACAASSQTGSARRRGLHRYPHCLAQQSSRLFVWDLFYRDLSTNERNLIGDWVGQRRAGQGLRHATRYHP